ncbi:MAG TPA: serine hydrolase domain-containing protein [Terrimicrobiaceae bacterium]|nr:serine hydrolase domain-containing protein [Terrimicrobiaceae bacterium]
MRPDLRFLAAASLVLTTLSARSGPVHAEAYSARHHGTELIIWNKGRIVWETSRNGGSPHRDAEVYSITKSLSALATLQAAGRGEFSLDEPVSRTITEWEPDPRKRAITVRALLAQTSGLASGYDALYAKGLGNKEATATGMPAVAPAGTAFSYGPSHYEALEVFVARRTRSPAGDLIDRSLLEPLGIRAAAWRKDRTGRRYFSAGAWLSAKDLLAIGHLIRRNGWQGIFSRIAPEMLREALSGTAANPMYGLGFWLNRHAAKPDVQERDIEEALSAGLNRGQWGASCVSRAAPPDLVTMAGSRGQRVYISRSRDLVIVRLGNGPGFRDPDFLSAYFARP